MFAGRARDVALRTISRNLRHADRYRAIQAAGAMLEDYELRTFDAGPDDLTARLRQQQAEQDSQALACARFVKQLPAGAATTADERRVRDCFAMDAPQGIVPPPIPPFRLLMQAADALPAGRTKAQLLYMARWERVPDRPPAGAKEAVKRLRALLPLLDSATRQEGTEQLDTTAVDLIEGRPDDAIARVRRSFARERSSGEQQSPSPAIAAQGLIADFLAGGDVDRAVAVTNLLPSSADCAMVDDGLTGVLELALVPQEQNVVAAYLSRLYASGAVERLCPSGLSDEIAADAWLKAGDEGKALDAANASGDPRTLGRIRLEVVRRRLSSGDLAGARLMARAAAAEAPALTAGTIYQRAATAAERVHLIHLLARVGETQEAQRLAAAYPGPGWRGFAYSVIVATMNSDRAGPSWAGPLLDLQEVPPDQ